MSPLNSIKERSNDSRTSRPHFIVEWKDLLFAHELALREGGLDGIINENSLRSALARPYSGYYASISEKAAALVEGIVRNHGFADGNKRTALLISNILVRKSGFINTASDDEFVHQITAIASGTLSFDELKTWFEEVLVKN